MDSQNIRRLKEELDGKKVIISFENMMIKFKKSRNNTYLRKISFGDAGDKSY